MIREVLAEILKKSFTQGWEKFLQSLTRVKTWITGSAGSFFSTERNIVDQELFSWWPIFDNNYGNIGVVFLLFFALIFVYYQLRFFLIEAWRRWILIKRESVYGKAIVLLAEGFSQIHKNFNKELNVIETKTILT